MNLSLRNVRTNKALSQETTCFSAALCLDGKPVGTVANRGHGGSNEYTWTDRETGAKIQAWAKEQPLEFQFEHLDQIVDEMLDKADAQARLKRLCSKKTLFRLKGDEQGAWRIVKAPYDEKVKALIAGKYGDKVECVANVDPAAAVKYC